MSEDLPRFDNRVTVESDGRIRVSYRPNNLGSHTTLVRRWSRLLKEIGFWVVMAHSHKGKNTTHQCGTLVFGDDPQTSVLDPWCRSHDVENLFVVDASFFPSSAAVNPALTIIAQSLRVAEHITATELRRALEPGARSLGPGAPEETHLARTLIQPRRHHRRGLQPDGAVLLGDLRLPAGGRGRYAGGARPRILRRRGRRSPRARSGGSACPAAACSRFSRSRRISRRTPFPWNRVGLTHFSFNVRNTQRWYDYLVANGVECVSRPERSPRGHTFFFARDPDGTLIELMDLGYMYHVVKWLGPLGGWIFRRGMYKQDYS